MNRMSLLYKRGNDTVQPGNLLFAGRQAAPILADHLMRFQVCFLSVVESLEQRAFINRRTDIADIRDMDPDCANLFNEIRTMLITSA